MNQQQPLNIGQRFPQGSRFIIFLCGLVALICPTRAMTQGNLLLMPRRVVFEGAKRYEELNLANTGQDTARYVISLVHYRMMGDGGFEEILQADSGENFADRYLRFFPHSVTLGPAESQVVKIQLTKINELAPGEYRSHIYFRAIPSDVPLGEKPAIADTSISIHLVAVFGISIPVIIRVGESTTHVVLSDLSLEESADKVPILNITFRRTGNMSVYGDLKAEFISAQGKITPVGEGKGIAVYTPTPSRRFRMNLIKIPGVDYRSGKLHVVYTTQVKSGVAMLAEEQLILK